MPFTRTMLGLLPLLLGACSGISPNPWLYAITPNNCYSDRTNYFTITGGGFVPATDMDPIDGTREVHAEGFSGRIWRKEKVGGKDIILMAKLSNIVWHSTSEIGATLTAEDAAELGTGICDVEITDPRGQVATARSQPLKVNLHGTDLVNPNFTLESPSEAAGYIPGSSITLTASASDSSPGYLTQISWVLALPGGETEFPPIQGTYEPSSYDETVIREYPIAIPEYWPAPSQAVLTVTVLDGASPPNSTKVTRNLFLYPAPRTLAMKPERGGEQGGTEVLVTGDYIVEGSRIYLNGTPLVPDGGTRLANGTMTGRTPPNTIGKATMTMSSPAGDFQFPDAFEYRPRPKIRGITPDHGPANTEIKVFTEGATEKTTIRIGPSLQSATPLISAGRPTDNSIVANVPAGIGTQIVWIFDPEFGFSYLLPGFTYTNP